MITFSLLFIAGPVAGLNSYTGTYHSTDTALGTSSIESPGVLKDESCTVTLEHKAYLVGSGFDTGVTHYSPATTPIGYASKTNKDLILCKTFGQFSSTSDLSGYYESYSEYTTTASAGNITLNTEYTCDETGLYYEVYGTSSDVDSNGNVVARYGEGVVTGAQPTTFYTDAYDSKYNDCYSDLNVSAALALSVTGSPGVGVDKRRGVFTYYPFNSGPEGLVTYTFDLGSGTSSLLSCDDSCTGTQSGYAGVYLVDVEDESYVTLYSYSHDCAGGPWTVSGTLTDDLVLDTDTEYVIAVGSWNDDNGATWGCPVSYYFNEPAEFNISVYVYEPVWNCTSWSDCEDGEEWRTCTDLNGIALPKTEFQTCAVTVLENATLGFEEYYTDFALKCSPTWLIYCGWQIQNITRDTPVGWTVQEDFADEGLQRDNLRMTSEWATEGSRSLKMWYIPPMMGTPIDNATCGNSTYGVTPVITQDVSNDTFSVAYNVTFPAENMMLSFDVKGCPDQVIQHDPLTTIFGIELCPRSCYAGNCTTTPDSAFQFFIRDESGDILTNYYDESVDPYESDTIELDLTGLGIVAGENYTLQFQALPENLNSQSGNCVMFDKVRYSVLAEPYLDVVGGDCSVGSRCIGTTLYTTHQYENGACVVVKKEDSCGLPSEILEKIENREDYCDLDDSDILNSYDYDISDWREVECEYGCEDDRCLTADDLVEQAEALSLYDPPELIADLLTEWGVTEDAFPEVWFFFSLFMLVNYFAILLGIGAALLVKGEGRDGGTSKDLWIPFTVVVFMILIGTTLGGYYPLEIGIPLIAFIGILLWKNSERIIGGG